MKTTYQKPTMDVIEMEIENALLAGSTTPQKPSNFQDFSDEGEA